MWAHKCNYVIINTPDVNVYHLYDDRRIYWNFHQLLWKTHGSKFPLCFASSWQVSDKLASPPSLSLSTKISLQKPFKLKHHYSKASHNSAFLFRIIFFWASQFWTDFDFRAVYCYHLILVGEPIFFAFVLQRKATLSGCLAFGCTSLRRSSAFP